VPAIDREFDYLIPAAWEEDGRGARIAIGSMVRVPLAGRRIAGWVTAVDIDPEPGVSLVPLAKLSGIGPSPEMIELADWAAWRWAGRRVPFLRAASPSRMVAAPAEAPPRRPVPSGPRDVFDQAFELDSAVVRVPPADDGVAVALAACRLGDALILVPDASRARRLALALRRAGIRTAMAPDDWAIAAGGATVIGTRSAAWMPMPALAAVVVIDEHDERFKDERTPAWHARDLVIERAKRRGVPVVMATPTPSLEALRAGKLLRLERSVEREAWPIVEVLDRRDDDPAKAGPFAERLNSFIGEGRVLCVLNRKGRARLLACAQCGELVRTEDGGRPMVLLDDRLESPDGSEHRPVVCAHCGSTTLKNLRVGVERAREELAAFVGERVDEVTGESDDLPTSRVVIGTEAILHRVDEADVIVFRDLDQELLALRQRAAEQAMTMVARAARILGERRPGARLVIQTRQPDHEVIQAVLRGDPALVAVAERDRRQPLKLPPYGAQVAVSGAGGEAFLESFGAPDGVQVRGPLDGRWLLRAETLPPILDALAETPRPAARVRVEVDPLRV
jgi:primosomal protein N' (replication factor Y)